MISDAICMLLRPQDFQLVNRGTGTHAGSTAKECTPRPLQQPLTKNFIVFKNCCITKTLTKGKKSHPGFLFLFLSTRSKKIKYSTQTTAAGMLGLIVTVTLIIVVWLTSKLHNIVLNLPEDNLKITYNFQHQFRFFIVSSDKCSNSNESPTVFGSSNNHLLSLCLKTNKTFFSL